MSFLLEYCVLFLIPRRMRRIISVTEWLLFEEVFNLEKRELEENMGL